MIHGIGHNGGPLLRDYQEEAVGRLFQFYDSPRDLDDKGKPKRKNAMVCLPTGTGKSLVIASFIQRAMMMVPNTRVMMLTHVKELIKQNANKMQEAWPLAPLGVFSAGLKSRDTMQPIIFGGVQSVVGKFPIFGHRDFLVIDEAHLVGDDGSYLKIITELSHTNPYLKIIGLSATPYRLGMGLVTNGPIFTDIVYDLCNIDGFQRLIAHGYLCPLVPKPTRTTLDVSNVSLGVDGDFAQGQLEAVVDKNDITYACLSEAMEWAPSRNCIMVFASGIKHAEHIDQMLRQVFNQSSVVMHSKLTQKHNDDALQDWKEGKYKWIVSMNKLTTGVDHAPVDLIIDMGPTMSTGKHVQKYGRGTRPYDFTKAAHNAWEKFLRSVYRFTKQNCLVLDFAGNVRRLGPINDPLIPRPKGKGPPGDAPVKICAEDGKNLVQYEGHAHINGCGFYNHASAPSCIMCGAQFKFQQKLEQTAYSGEIMASDMPQIEYFDVLRQVMTPHVSKAGFPQVKVAYFCNPLKTFYEFVNVESPYPLVKHKAREWFRQRYHYRVPVDQLCEVDYKDNAPVDAPKSNADFLRLAPELRHPKRLKVWVNKRPNPEVTGYEF